MKVFVAYYNVDNLNIKDIQKELTERSCVEVDFLGSWNFIVTYDDIYVFKDSPVSEDLDILYFFKIWNYEEQRDYYTEYRHIEIEDYDDETLDKILEDMIKQCKYTVDDGFYTTKEEFQKKWMDIIS